MKPPEKIIGFPHDKPEANQGKGCFCGCQWAESCTGTLRRDDDTEKLIELGGAIYDFESPYHRDLSVYYRLEELEGRELKAERPLVDLVDWDAIPRERTTCK